MGKVVAQAIMSLDGYVARQDNTIGRLFDWLQNGEVEIPDPVRSRGGVERAAHAGRPRRGRHAPHAGGVDGRHPDAPFSFVTDGVAAAVARARELAGDRNATDRPTDAPARHARPSGTRNLRLGRATSTRRGTGLG